MGIMMMTSIVIQTDNVNGWPKTHYTEYADLKLRALPASVSQVLGIKACTKEDAETHSQTLSRAQGTPYKKGRKDCRSQRD